MSDDIAALQQKLEEQAKELKGLQELRGKWANDVGEAKAEAMKKVEDLEGQIKTLAEDRETVRKELEALKTRKPDGQEPAAEKKPLREQADELEAKLSDKEKQELDKMLDALENSAEESEKEMAKKFVSDDKVRLTFLQQARETEAHPERWRVKKPSQTSVDDVKRTVEKLFKKHQGKVTLDERGGSPAGARRVSNDAKPPPKWL